MSRRAYQAGLMASDSGPMTYAHFKPMALVA